MSARASDPGLALAYPVAAGQIQIDGDLSDWPTHLPRYPIQTLVLGAAPTDAADCSAWFRLAYGESENVLYAGVEVQDADREEAPVDPLVAYVGELAIVIVRVPDGDEGIPRLPLGFLRTEDLVNEKGERVRGEATMTAHGGGDATYAAPQYFRSAIRHAEDRWWCEYRIDIGGMTRGSHRVGADQRLECNVWVVDHDRLAGSTNIQATMLGWVNENALQPRDGRGDVWLVRSNAVLGHLSGQVRSSDGEPPGTEKRLRLQSVTPPGPLLRAVTDREGGFALDLPAGSFRVAVDQRGVVADTNAVITLAAGGQARVELTAPPLTGRVVPAGPGRVIPVGRGNRRGAWLTFGVADGLPGAGVGPLLQDRRGDLWFIAAGEGVVRFDGARFTVFGKTDGLASDHVMCLAEDGRGNLWFGSHPGVEALGVTCYDRQQELFVTYDREDGPGLHHAQEMAVDRAGGFWFSANSSVHRWDAGRKQFVRYTRADGGCGPLIGPIHQGKSGRLWVGPFCSNELCEWQDGRFVVHRTPVPLQYCLQLHEDSRGGLWMVGASAGNEPAREIRWRYDVGTGRWQDFGAKDGWPSGFVGAVYEDREGQLWVGGDAGLLRSRGGRLEPFGAVTGLGHVAVRAIFEDRQGGLWVGAEGIGLARLDRAWRTYTETNGLAGDGIQVLAEWDGRLVAGTARGLSRLRPAQGGGPAWEPMIEGNVTALRPSRRGLLCLRNAEPVLLGPDGTLVSSNLLAGMTTSFAGSGSDLIEDPQGRVWVASRGNGLAIAGAGQIEHYTTLNGLPSDLLTAVAWGPDGRLWVGTIGDGVFRWDGDRRFPCFRAHDGLAGNWVTAIAGDCSRGWLWVGTTAGLSCFDGQHWRTFRQAEGMPTDSVTSLKVDRRGRLWIGTTGGGVAVYDAELNVFQHLAWRHGLAHDTVSTLQDDQDGAMWIGTPAGLSRYVPQTNAPAVRITRVMANGRVLYEPALPPARSRRTGEGARRAGEGESPPLIAVGRGRRSEGTSGVAAIILAGRPKRLVVELEGVSLGTHPDDMVYLCQLVEHGSQERPVHARQVEYTDLPYGKYDFRVRAVDRDLNVSPVAALQLLVRPDYAQVGLFGALGGALCVGLVASGLAIKHRRERNGALLERNRSLEQAKASAETAREAAESANRAKSLFLANMSHEIRTPMHAILGYSQILRRDRDTTATQRQALHTIERSGQHLLAMINDILDLAKIEAGKMEVRTADFDLLSLVQDVAAMCRIRCEQKRLTFEVECRVPNAECRNAEGLVTLSEMFWVRSDESKLRQVLLNLLGNAVKFTEQGGVTLRVSPVAGGQMQPGIPDAGCQMPDAGCQMPDAGCQMPDAGCRMLDAGSRVTDHASRITDQTSLLRFEVTDTGPGMAPELQARLFRPFQQGGEGLKHGGTGLGLAISRRQVELMGGELKVESVPGQGSRFWFEIPLRPGTAPVVGPGREEVRVVKHLVAGSEVRVLVVDDVAENRDVLSQILGAIGCHVMVAPSGPEALALLHGVLPHMVFMDIRMPGMDGKETARRIWDAFGRDQVKIVALSASAFDQQRQEYLACGFDGFIGKPFRVEEIHACLRDLLKVEFEYAEEAEPAPSDTALAVQPGDIVLPSGILRRLREAAKRCSATRIEAGLAELEQDGETGRRVVAHLRRLVHAGDMAAVADFLREVRDE